MNATSMVLSQSPSIFRPAERTSTAMNLPYTQINVIRFTYTWTTTVTTHGLQTALQSPVFSVLPDDQLRWKMKMSSSVTFGTENVSLFLCCEDSRKYEVEAKFRFRLFNADDESVVSPEMTEYCVFERETARASYGYAPFCSANFLYRKCRTTNIVCEIEVHHEEDNFSEQDEEPYEVPDGRILEDMVSVFTTGKYADFVITTDGIDFPVHKAILSARSTVLAAMFEKNAEDNEDNRLEITNMKPEALREMLRFIYTDSVMYIETVAQDLLAAAEKFALDRLKVMCVKALFEILAVENAAEILILADCHRADELKAQALDFINTRTINVMETSGFKAMITSHPMLMAEILRASVTKRSRDDDDF